MLNIPVDYNHQHNNMYNKNKPQKRFLNIFPLIFYIKTKCDSLLMLQKWKYFQEVQMCFSCQGQFWQFIACSNCKQSLALFKNIFKFCTFFAQILNILLVLSFLNIFLPFFWKITCMSLLSRIGPVCTLLHIAYSHHLVNSCLWDCCI